MSLQVNTIMLGVEDLGRAKAFYAGGLGCEVVQDYKGFVNLSLGAGSPTLALYEREDAARDAGVSPEGSGFSGVSFHYITDARDTVDEVIAKAHAAGGTVAKAATEVSWGYYGYFADPDGNLWKVATSA